MDYLVDQLPLDLSPETRKFLSQKAFNVILWADWFCGARDVRDIFDNHTSFLACGTIFIICSLLTFIHACRHGARYVYLWLGAIAFGLVAELYFSNPVSGQTLFWHSQGVLTLFGRRTPAYVILGLYPSILYTSIVASSKLILPWWASGSASALLSLLLSAPYGILSTKLLWITWHDTHPHVKDRLFDTPCTFYYFVAASAFSFDLCVRSFRRLFLPIEYDWKLFIRETLCVVFGATAAFGFTLLQFVPVYNFFHDVHNVSAIGCLLLFVGLLAYLFWSSDRKPMQLARPHVGYNDFWFDELCVMVIFYFLFFTGLILVVDPYNINSTGLHQPLGTCDVYENVQGVFGTLSIKLAKYLCPTRFNEPYFDFHCLPDGKAPNLFRPGQTLEWYTLCGTGFQNLPNYIFVIWAFSLLGLMVFYQILAKSGEVPVIPVKKYQKRKND